jgi:hypothetical protein
MSIGTIILIILVIALLGGFSGIGGGPFYGTGYYGGGGLGLVIVILLILLLLGRLSVFRTRRVGKGALAPCPPLHTLPSYPAKAGYPVLRSFRDYHRRSGIVDHPLSRLMTD